MKKPPTDEELKETVKKLLASANLEEVTMKQICKEVYENYPAYDLTERKEFIKTTVKELISWERGQRQMTCAHGAKDLIYIPLYQQRECISFSKSLQALLVELPADLFILSVRWIAFAVLNCIFMQFLV